MTAAISRERLGQILNGLSFCAFLLLFFIPAPYFSGDDAAALSVIRILSILTLFLALIQSWLSRAPFLPAYDWRLLKWPLIIFSLFFVYVFIQWISENPIFPKNPLASASPVSTFRYLEQLVFYLIFFFICLHFFSSRERIRVVVFLLGIQIAFLMALGFYQKLSGLKPFSKIYGVYALPPYMRGHFYSSFIQDDAYGAFLSLAAPIFLGAVVYACQGGSKGRRSQADTGQAIFFAGLLPMMLVSSIHAQARLPFIAQLIMLALFLWIALSTGNGLKIGLFCIGFLGVAGFFIFRVHPDIVEQFGGLLGHAFNFRLGVLEGSAPLFLDRPFFGAGLGSSWFLAKAHHLLEAPQRPLTHFYNEHLELLIETGIVGYVLFAAPLVMLAVDCFTRCLRSPSRWCRLMGVSSFAALLVFTLFLLADSHLKVPAVAMLWIGLLALLQKCSGFYSVEDGEP